MDLNRYDRLTPVYDRLAMLVLGRHHQQSKYCFLEQLKRGDQVLVIGGGTGENLPVILGKIGSEGKLFFVEASKAMIEKARLRLPQDSDGQVEFFHQTEFEQLPKGKFDVVITQYLMDILTDEEVTRLFKEMEKRIHQESLWLLVDFFDDPKRKWLLWLMITFFRFFTKNPRKNLPDYEAFFKRHGWKLMRHTSFEQGWIKAMIFKKEKLANINY